MPHKRVKSTKNVIFIGGHWRSACWDTSGRGSYTHRCSIRPLRLTCSIFNVRRTWWLKIRHEILMAGSGKTKGEQLCGPCEVKETVFLYFTGLTKSSSPSPCSSPVVFPPKLRDNHDFVKYDGILRFLPQILCQRFWNLFFVSCASAVINKHWLCKNCAAVIKLKGKLCWREPNNYIHSQRKCKSSWKYQRTQ